MKQRYEWLDLWRSLAVLVMVVFHALWDLEHFGVLPSGTMETPLADAVRYLGGGSFILISGLVAPGARDPIRRGFRLFCIGLLVSAVSWLAGLPVKFGILQLLGVSKMLVGALDGTGGKLRRASLAPLWLLLWLAAWIACSRADVPWDWLFPLGLHSAGFFSADYWPLLPWLFLYLMGVSLGSRLRGGGAAKRIPSALTFPGRHSLIVYLLHQPLLYGLFWLLFSGKN